jgi:aryl-alcohol dehydrogenase-like predicted oxidoreductase
LAPGRIDRRGNPIQQRFCGQTTAPPDVCSRVVQAAETFEAAWDAGIRYCDTDGGVRALERLRSEGVVKTFGVGVNEWKSSHLLRGNGAA